jgi:hypothetical protein
MKPETDRRTAWQSLGVAIAAGATGFLLPSAEAANGTCQPVEII